MSAALEQLEAAAAGAGLRLTEHALALFDRYLREILAWRTRVNLIPAADAAQIVGLHLIDALTALSACDFPRGCRVVDVGSGAGLPGLPLKILRPDLRVTLIEASRRRVGFLEHARSVLDLTDVEIEWTRAEEFGRRPDRREAYDRSVERATARLAVAAELCLPLVRLGGTAVFLKGSRVVAEVDRLRALIETLGGRVVRTDTRALPRVAQERAAVVIGKAGRTPSKFPRNAAHQGLPP